MKIRINRFLAMCGVASRREADRLIRKGSVSVDGRIVAEPGLTIDPGTVRVEVDGRRIRPERLRYIVFNKPRLCLTALGTDPEGKRTLSGFLEGIEERVYPTGRLDYDAEGLLILTNDGELAQRILHPRFEMVKHYLATVRGTVTGAEVEGMRKGAELTDGPAVPDSIKVFRTEGRDTVLAIAFHEGRNRLVKRFFEAFGLGTLRLRRTGLGPVRLGRLAPGEWRDMSPRVLAELRDAAGLS